MQKITPRTPSRSGGLRLIGIIGLIAGANFCIKRPRRARETVDTGSSDSLRRLGIIGAGLIGVALGSTIKRGKPFSTSVPSDVRLESHVIIDRPANEVYRYWKDLRHLPRVMNFIKQVEPQEGNISHWVAQGPLGPSIEWDSEIIDDGSEERLSWQSLEGSDLRNWGTVTFTPRNDDTATDLAIVFNFSPPENVTGTLATFLSGVENISLDQNLINLKHHLESEEDVANIGALQAEKHEHGESHT